MQYLKGDSALKNNKLRYAAFNLRLQLVIVDNWRFLSSVCRVLNLVYGWGEKRLNRCVDSAAEYVKDRFGIELDTSLQDYHGILKARGKAEKAILDERKKAGTFLEAFRKWSEEYNPKEERV